MNSMKIQHLVLVVALLIVPAMRAMNAMNILRPYDTLIRPAYSHKYPWQLGIIAEGGLNTKAYNSDNHGVGSAKMWNCTQNSLAMLDGFPSDSTIGKKRIAVDASDDGTRGHFCVSSDIDVQFAGSAALRSFFGESWSVGMYMPFYVMKLNDVCWQDLTKDITDEDARVKELLTDDFFENVRELSGIDLSPWKRQGIGDVTLLLEWFNDFQQAKPMLRNVRVHWRAGVGLPTGLRQDEDRVLALPFGRDGAFSIPFGMGLDLSFVFHLRVGFNVDLMHTFGNTRCRRIKTAPDQTDLLFLQKAQVYKDFGLMQYFSLYAQLYQLFGGESLMIGYQFTKQGSDEVSIIGTEFSSAIANTAESLREWTMHQLIFRADYDFGYDKSPEEWRVNPRVSFYARVPFNGRRITTNTMIGATFALDF